LELPIRSGDSKALWRMEGLIALVGRADACQLVLSDESVSRFHALLIRTSGGLWIVDLRARQGIRVNGVSVRWAWLDDGDALKVGQFSFKVRYDSPPDQIGRADVPLSAGEIGESPDRSSGVPAVQPLDKGGRALALRAKKRAPVPAPRAATHTAQELRVLPQEPTWQPAGDIPPRQLAMWQQQMRAMESFHNDMILMVQMFAAMHREHLSSVRDELDHVRQLTRELSDLQQGLLDAPAPAGKPARSGSDPAPGRPESKPAPGPASSRGDRGVPEKRPKTNRSSPAPETRQRPPTPPAPPKAVTDGLSAPIPPPLEVDALGLHGALCQRIAELQKERQGYWRKILGSISK
jgi:hypothetical protein